MVPSQLFTANAPFSFKLTSIKSPFFFIYYYLCFKRSKILVFSRLYKTKQNLEGKSPKDYLFCNKQKR